MKRAAIGLIAVCAACSAFAGGVISVNIANADGSSGLVGGSTAYGLAPAVGDSWLNVTETEPNPFALSVPSESRDGEVKSLDGVTVKFASSGSFGRYWPGGVDVAEECPFFKQYIDDGSGAISVSVEGIPYRAYNVIVYLGADWAGSTGGWSEDGPDFHPVSVNSTWYGYSEDEQATVKCGQGDYWGRYGTGSAVEGVNTLRIPLQVGSKLELNIPVRWPRRSCLCAFQIVESDEEVTTPDAVISVNFGDPAYFVSGLGGVSGLAGGYVPAASWNNMEGASGTDVAVSNVWNGVAFETETDKYKDLKISWFGDNLYHDGDSSFDPFLRGFLTDNNVNPPSVTVGGIPFRRYDLIVYMAADWNWHYYHPDCTNLDFQAVRLGGKTYTWGAEAGKTVEGADAWGLIQQPKAAFGVNALRICDLTDAELEFYTHSQNANGRGNIAAFQLVKRDYVEIVAAGDITTKEINRLAGENEVVFLTLPAGATVTLSRNRPLKCRKLYLISEGSVHVANWNNIAPTDETDVAKMDSTAVKGALFHAWKPTARIISLNFNAEKGAMSGGWEFKGALGAEEMPAMAWNDIPGDDSSVPSFQPVVWDGAKGVTNGIDGLNADWTYGGTYGWGSSPDPFMRGWLDANGQGAWTLDLTGLPFEKYDVIFYCNWDGADAFRPIKVNGEFWTWDEEKGMAVKGAAWNDTWGRSSCDAAAELGRNAMRISGLTASTLSVYGEGLFNLCAIQIIEYCPPPKERVNGFVVTLH